MTATFHTSRNDLPDESATFDVYTSDEYGQTLIAEPPSENSAEELARVLNAVRDRFLDCGSDREVASLAAAFDRFFAVQSKKAA